MTRRIAILLLASCLPATAHADRPKLEEVIVTATRTEARMLDYAGSATRLEGAEIAAVGATHHAEIINRAPGAYLQRGSGQESLTALRSPVLTGPGSCGAFLFLEDGVPLRPVGFCNVNQLFEANVEQAASIEVLRGPGSALYGSNAVHGIVNVLNPGPGDLPPLQLGIEGGSFGYLRGKLAASGPLGAAAAGLAAHLTRDDGWREDSGFDEQKLASSLALPAGAGTLTLRLNGSNLEQETAGFIVGENAYKDPEIARSNPNPEAFRDAWSLRAAAHYTRPLADGQRLDARAVLRSSRMTFLQHFLLGQPLERNGQDSVGFLLSRSFSPTAGGTLLAGVDAELASGFLQQEQDGPTTDGPPAANAIRPAGKHYDYEVDSALLAPYLQWEQRLAGHLSLTAGLRYEWLRYDYDNRMLDGNTDENGVPCPGGGCLYNRPADRTDSFSNLGPRVGLSWRIRDDSSAWASVTRGFRPPEATELYRLQRGQDVADLDSERIDGVEVGVRHLADRLSLELAAFWMDKENVILRDSAGFNVGNGATRHRGLEYGFDWEFLAGWRLSGSGTLARHTYASSGLLGGGEQVTSGDDVDTAPRQLHSLRLAWAGARLRTELEWQSVGSYWADAANTARYPGHELLNLRVALVAAPGLSVTLRVTNLLDAAYADRADFAFGSYRYFPGRPRAAFLEFTWRRD
jgi:iron complex outermembrane receptor protein